MKIRQLYNVTDEQEVNLVKVVAEVIKTQANAVAIRTAADAVDQILRYDVDYKDVDTMTITVNINFTLQSFVDRLLELQQKGEKK